MYTMASGKGINSERLQFTAAGFKVFKDGVDGGTSTVYPPLINSKGIQYVYIAFRSAASRAVFSSPLSMSAHIWLKSARIIRSVSSHWGR